jgi:hypothetical protein
VHEPDIAPLARRLAEENNVDWRHLAGSGDGGRVVERDVLGYLARVMAGEEDVDPTPEPVPDGMVAWPEDDVAAYRARDAHASEVESPPTLDDELFLFDDEPADELEVAGLGHEPDLRVPVHGNGAIVAEDDALLLVGDESDQGGAPSSEGDGGWSADERRIDELPDLTEAAPADDEPPSDDLHTLGGRSSHPLPDLFASDDAPSAAPDGGEPELLFDELDDADHDGSDGARSADDGGDGVGSADEGGDVAWSADGGGDDAWSADGALSAAHDTDGALSDADGSDGALSVADGGGSADDEIDGELSVAEGASSPDGGDGGVRPSADVAFVPFGDGDGDGTGAIGTTIGALAASDDAERPAQTVADLPGVAFVRHGQVWRRRFDDRPLRKAVSEVASELQAAPGAVTALLLARAVWRAGAVIGPIDVMQWHGGQAFRGPASGDLRTAVGGLASAEASRPAGEAVLVVADLSQLDLDEAVLHLESPVLTLGRSLGDASWLCLSGDDVDPAVVNALAGIAELLTTPVRLLV